MTRTIGVFPPTHLSIERGQNGAPALADVPRALAGNAASVKGLLSGGSTVGSANAAPNPSPRNFSGDYGHDHSGGYFGRPLFRSVATVWLSPIDADSVAGMTMLEASTNTGAAGATTRTVAAGPTVWIPPCDPNDGAYRDLAVVVRLEIISTSLEPGDVLTVTIINNTANRRGRNSEATLVILGEDSTGVKVAESGVSSRLRCVPGMLNELSFRFTADRDGTAGSRSAIFRVLDLELGVYES